MPEDFLVGDRVEVYLNSDFWESEGWFPGVISRIDPYTAHRFFYWVDLDVEARASHGDSTRLVSVLNPKNIRKPGMDRNGGKQ
jgi:hypothetical protein